MTRLLTFASALAVVACTRMFAAVDAEAVSFVEPRQDGLAALPPQGSPIPAG